VLPVRAHEYHTNNFTLIHPWSEPSGNGSTDAYVYCIFDNVLEDDKLIKVYSSIAQSVEIRETINTGESPWRVLAELQVPASASMRLEPAGVYLALKDLRAPLQWGRSYPMFMQFERAGMVNVMVSIGAH
jgi:copper(I)-binding protein